MKIALLTPGGADRTGTHRVLPFLLDLLEEFTPHHDVHVFQLRHEPRPSRYALLGATVHNIGLRPRVARAVRAVVAEHARGPFDFIYALWAEAGLSAAFAGRLLGRPVLLHLIGGDLVTVPDIAYGVRLTRFGRLWLRVAVGGATRLLVPSEPARADAARLGLDAVRVPLSVSLERWPARPPVPRTAGDVARLVHVANLNRVKDQPTLLRALGRLRDQGVSFRLDVVGEDTLNGVVQRLAGTLGLSDRVTFHGFLPRTDLRPVVERSHVLLMASRHETGPVVALEAALAGVPTVGTAVGHIAEWAPDAAIAVAPGDDAGLAAGLAAVLADEPRRLAIAAEAQKRAIAQDVSFTVSSLLAQIPSQPVRTA